MNDFSQRLRSERKRLGLSQEELAALASVSKNTQSNYETGVRLPDVGYLNAIEAVGVDSGFVLTGLRTFDPNAVCRDRSALTVAARLQQERERLGLTDTELARMIGLDKQTLQKFEAGELVPDAVVLEQLHAVGVDVGYVLLSINIRAPRCRPSEEIIAFADDLAALLERHQRSGAGHSGMLLSLLAAAQNMVVNG